MTDRRNLMLRLAIGLALVMLAAACTVPGPPGPAGPQGPAGASGPAEPQGPAEPDGGQQAGLPAYSPELYDDCRDAFGSISPAGLRRLWAASGDASALGEMTDDDVRGLLKLGCLVIATGAGDIPWGGLVTVAPRGGTP